MFFSNYRSNAFFSSHFSKYQLIYKIFFQRDESSSRFRNFPVMFFVTSSALFLVSHSKAEKVKFSGLLFLSLAAFARLTSSLSPLSSKSFFA